MKSRLSALEEAKRTIRESGIWGHRNYDSPNPSYTLHNASLTEFVDLSIEIYPALIPEYVSSIAEIKEDKENLGITFVERTDKLIEAHTYIFDGVGNLTVHPWFRCPRFAPQKGKPGCDQDLRKLRSYRIEINDQLTILAPNNEIPNWIRESNALHWLSERKL